MTLFKRIIVGHDLRKAGEISVRAATILARRSGAALKLVHVVEPYPLYQTLSHPLTTPYTLEELTARAGKELDSLTSQPELTGLRVDYEVRTGKPFIQLILAERAWQGDLIVVGGAARGNESMLGSTSERIARKAQTPVLVAKAPLIMEAPVLLVPTDFSECSRKAALLATSFAESFGGRIVFLHVIELNYIYSPSAGDHGAHAPLLTADDLEEEWQIFLSELPLANLSWERFTHDGRAATTIIREVERLQPRLIVMGTHGRSNFANMLVGSVAEEVVRDANCSILTVRPEAFRFELP